MRIDRLPAIPLIASDPYFSIWMPYDNMATADTIHWCGPIKPIRMAANIDGKNVSFLGRNRDYEAQQQELIVTPTKTRFVSEFGGVQLEAEFVTPALPDDPDLMSMPVTLLSLCLRNTDGKAH